MDSSQLPGPSARPKRQTLVSRADTNTPRVHPTIALRNSISDRKRPVLDGAFFRNLRLGTEADNTAGVEGCSEGNSGTEEGSSTKAEDNAEEKSKIAKSGTGHLSEHGHHLQEIRPMAKHSGKSVVTFFTGLFQTMIAISTLGTSVTFSFILTGNTQLGNPTGYYREGQIVTFLAVSWLLFLLNLAFASLGSTLLTFFKAHWVRDWDGAHGVRSQLEVQLYAVLVSGLLGGLIIGAFVFLCLVVVAYSPVVGWIALGFTSWFGLIIAVSVTWQLPWPWRDNTPDEGRKTP